jgi:hypothetical protein
MSMFSHPPVKTSRRKGPDVAPTATLGRAQPLPGAAPATADLGQGQQLSADQRAVFESRLGHDFSGVRVHADGAAAAAASAMGANAYSIGEDIVFAGGRYRPGTASGDRLIAHELAHVAQQQRGGSAGPAQAEPRARAAADAMSAGTRISPAEIGGAQQGVYCDDDEEKKKQEEGGQSPPTSSGSSAVPPVFSPPTLPLLDWGKIQEPYTRRGMRLTMRDVDSILLERQRSSQVLTALGIGEGFKLGPFTKNWILEKGLSKQLEDQQARENPTAIDQANKDWKLSHPGGLETPMITIFDIDWLRRNKK